MILRKVKNFSELIEFEKELGDKNFLFQVSRTGTSTADGIVSIPAMPTEPDDGASRKDQRQYHRDVIAHYEAYNTNLDVALGELVNEADLSDITRRVGAAVQGIPITAGIDTAKEWINKKHTYNQDQIAKAREAISGLGGDDSKEKLEEKLEGLRKETSTASGADAAAINSKANKQLEVFKAMTGLYGQNLEAFVKKTQPIVDSDARFYQKLDEKNDPNVGMYIAESEIRNYLVEEGIAGGVTLEMPEISEEMRREFYAISEQKYGERLEFPEDFTVPDFTRLEVNPAIYERANLDGTPASGADGGNLFLPANIVFIAGEFDEKAHESSGALGHKYAPGQVINLKKEGNEFFFVGGIRDGEKLTSEDLELGTIYNRFTFSGAILKDGHGELTALYHRNKEAEELLFQKSMTPSEQGNFSHLLSGISNDYARLGLSKSLTSALDNGEWIQFILKALKAVVTGMVSFGEIIGMGKSAIKSSLGITTPTASDNIIGKNVTQVVEEIEDPEKKLILESVFDDMRIDVSEKEQIMALVAGDGSLIVQEFAEMRDNYLKAGGKNVAALDRVIEVVTNIDTGITVTSQDLDIRQVLNSTPNLPNADEGEKALEDAAKATLIRQ